jgi:alpha-tubulin suppressor-like RCC1 family protein
MPNSPTSPRLRRLLAGRFVAAALLATVLSALSAPAAARAEAGASAVAWGDNVYAELGAGYKSLREESPVSVLGLSNITSVALGYHFNLVLLGDGTVRTWGGNALGQLGDKTHLASGTPTSIGLHGVRRVAAGGAHALALLENGTVANWGANEFGELGNGLLNPVKRVNARGQIETTMQGSGSPEPVVVPNVQNVVGVASGGGTEFALLSNGTVLAWGKNNKGQLGIGQTGPQICKTEVGEVPCNTKPEAVLLQNREALHDVAAIAAGSEAAYALLANGHVMAWGNNGRGQLGNGSTANSDVAVEVKSLDNVVALSAGAPYALALLSNGRVMGWGGNGSHQLGVQANESCQTEPCVRTPRLLAGLENVSAVSAGRAFTLALIRGTVWALGDNEPWGQLGLGGLLSSSTPRPIEGLPAVALAAAGEQHALAVLQSGAGPQPRFSVTPGGASLNVGWTVAAPVSALRWRVFNTYSEGGGSWSPMVYFRQQCTAAVPCSYRIGSLPAVPYEVELISNPGSAEMVTRRAVATP